MFLFDSALPYCFKIKYLKAVFPIIDDALPLHARELARHGAAVYAEVIGKFRAVERNQERVAFLPALFRKQVGLKLFFCRAAAHEFDLTVELDILEGKHPRKAADQPAVEPAGAAAHGEKFFRA